MLNITKLGMVRFRVVYAAIKEAIFAGILSHIVRMLGYFNYIFMNATVHTNTNAILLSFSTFEHSL